MRILPVLNNNYYIKIIIITLKKAETSEPQNFIDMTIEIIVNNLKLEKHILVNLSMKKTNYRLSSQKLIVKDSFQSSFFIFQHEIMFQMNLDLLFHLFNQENHYDRFYLISSFFYYFHQTFFTYSIFLLKMKFLTYF